jgi:threonine dehydrogenase-like Zn-dependent dehydrogenase
MNAVRIYGPGDLRVEQIGEPQVLEATDVVLEVTAASITGLDLDRFHGTLPVPEPGTTCGQELVGEIVESGSAVVDFAVGDRCVAFVPAGAQAEYVRVPSAESALALVPDGLSDFDVVLCGKILPAAWSALQRGGARGGDVVTVVGAGTLGQLVILFAPLFGCSAVIAVDTVDARLREAEALGAVPVDARTQDPVACALEVTAGRGADLVIETARIATCAGEPVPRGHREQLVRLIEAGRIDPARVISHALPFSEAKDAYRIFDANQATTIVLKL